MLFRISWMNEMGQIEEYFAKTEVERDAKLHDLREDGFEANVNKLEK